MKNFIIVFFSFFFITNTFGFSGDSIRISLLTVLPRPNEVYTIYGHTALRVSDISSKFDVVFNYGTFNSNAPNFLYHFIKGETDYYLDAYDFDLFLFSYQKGNSTIIEQMLNIPPAEKEKMMGMLFVNLQPENRGYRYNFLFDNCTTRARDIIEKFAGGNLIYEEKKDSTTFRTLIHGCTNPYPWMTFGIDLLIGSGADSLISFRQEMFLPEKLMDGLETAYVTDSLGQRSIVLSSEVILQSFDAENSRDVSWFSPMKTGIILLVITLVLGVCGLVNKRRFRLFFALLFFTAGVIGCIIWFVAFFSIHPCTFPNSNVFFFHPLYFIAMVGYLLPKTYRFITWYHWINFVLLSVLLIAWPFMLQEINLANLPFVLCLWVGLGRYLKL